MGEWEGVDSEGKNNLIFFCDGEKKMKKKRFKLLVSEIISGTWWL